MSALALGFYVLVGAVGWGIWSATPGTFDSTTRWYHGIYLAFALLLILCAVAGIVDGFFKGFSNGPIGTDWP